MELWDVYDENRKMTGKTHERGVPLGPGEYHIIADVWTVNQRSEILLTRRHPDKPYGLLWECTGGSCLLYTSPSPRDTERSRMPSSA